MCTRRVCSTLSTPASSSRYRNVRVSVAWRRSRVCRWSRRLLCVGGEPRARRSVGAAQTEPQEQPVREVDQVLVHHPAPRHGRLQAVVAPGRVGARVVHQSALCSRAPRRGWRSSRCRACTAIRAAARQRGRIPRTPRSTRASSVRPFRRSGSSREVGHDHIGAAAAQCGRAVGPARPVHATTRPNPPRRPASTRPGRPPPRRCPGGRDTQPPGRFHEERRVRFTGQAQADSPRCRPQRLEEGRTPAAGEQLGGVARGEAADTAPLCAVRAAGARCRGRWRRRAAQTFAEQLSLRAATRRRCPCPARRRGAGRQVSPGTQEGRGAVLPGPAVDIAQIVVPRGRRGALPPPRRGHETGVEGALPGRRVYRGGVGDDPVGVEDHGLRWPAARAQGRCGRFRGAGRTRSQSFSAQAPVRAVICEQMSQCFG